MNTDRELLVAGLSLMAAVVASADYLSPCALAPAAEGHVLYVAECTAWQVAVVDPAKSRVASTIALPARPNGLALMPDGRELCVAGGGAEGRLFVVDTKTRAVTRTIPVGHTPMAPVVTSDGRTAFVCCRFSNAVWAIDLRAGNVAEKIPVQREPVAAALTPDGRFLFVANHLPAGPATADHVAACVSVIDTADRKVVAQIELPDGSSGLRGMCMSPDGRHVYVTHILGRYRVPTTQLERGWINTNALTIIDVRRRETINTVLLDDVNLGAANPWGVACSPDGRFVCVAHAGTHELSVIDRAALHRRLDAAAAGRLPGGREGSAGDVSADLGFLVGIRRRTALPGNGPRGLAVVDGKVYAAEYFSDSLAVVELDPDGQAGGPRSVALGPRLEPTRERKGEMLFNDAALCFQKWQSCASCHPDARADGLNWDLLNDGIGNAKQAKSMLWAHRTPPAMVSGIRDKAETAVRAGIRYILMAVRPAEDAAAIDAYLAALEPVPSPYLLGGRLSKAAARGRRIFEKADCWRCHPGPLCTDLEAYDVGVGTGPEEGRAFDTPTLVESWRTAPYLHDGRCATMDEVLTVHNPQDRHGRTSGLSPQEIADLVEFVLSL